MVNKELPKEKTTERSKRKGNVTIQKNEKSKKKHCTSKVMCNKFSVVGWISIGFE